MPRVQSRQESGPQSQESAWGDGVPINGVEGQAVRRAHMREQTTARQAAERHLGYPPIRRKDHDYRSQVAARVAEVRAELARINAEHQTWLLAHGGGHGAGAALDADPTTEPASAALSSAG